MPRAHIPAALRREVVERASGQCEFCRLHQDDAPFAHQVDHLTPLKRGGETVSANLALACLDCNRHKGSDLAAIDPADGVVVMIFNPRQQRWEDHFALEGARIVGMTPTGRATANLLRFNVPLHLSQRNVLMRAGRYPVSSSLPSSTLISSL